jgi:putative transposase
MFGDDGLLHQLAKAVVERALESEMTHHLGYEKHDPAGVNSGNSRNGKSAKTIRGKRGQLQIEVPRDRDSSFAPQLIKKGQTRFDSFDDKIISLYSRGMTCREIKAHLEEIYGAEVSPDLRLDRHRLCH